MSDDSELPGAQYPMCRIEDQGYRITIETTDHIGSTTFAGHHRHKAVATIGLDDTPELVDALDEILDEVREDHMVYQYGCQNCDTPFRSKRELENDECFYCADPDVVEYDQWIQS